MKKVLQLSYYPAIDVVSGGERRIDAMRHLIRKLGCKLDVYGIYHAYQQGDLGTNFIQLSREQSNWCFSRMSDWELRMTDVVQIFPKLFKQFNQYLVDSKPDIIWLEHPYQWPLVKHYCRAHSTSVVYDAHNIEWQLKQRTLLRSGLLDELAINRLFSTELSLITSSSLVLCCSSDDLNYCQSVGGKCLLVPNGNNSPLLQKSSDLYDEISKKYSKRKIFSFISAAHEPNWFGLRDLVLKTLKNKDRSEDFLLIIMGDICQYYKEWEKENGKYDNVITLGRVSEIEKSDIYKLSDVILLPITEGGGELISKQLKRF